MNCTLELAQKMISASICLYEEKPWDLFDEHEVFEISKVEHGLTAYCLFHRLNGKKSITIFSGPEGFTNLSNMFKKTGLFRVDAFQYFERESYEIIFDQPEQLEEDDIKLGEQMGYTPRELPLIRYCEKRCYADQPNNAEAERLIKFLQGLSEGMKAYLDEGMNLDFHKNRFVYNVEKKSCFSKRTAYRPKKYDIVEIDYPELMEEILELEEIEEVWEYDLQPTAVAIQRLEDQRTQPLYLAALADPVHQQVLAGIPLKSDLDFQFQCIDLIIEAIMQRGIPKAVMVRHPLVGAAVMDLCKTLDSQLVPVEHFEVLDEFYDGLKEHLERKNERC